MRAGRRSLLCRRETRFSDRPFPRSANSRHSYSFPRIYGIMNDGTKSYDVGKDGQGQEIGACSVRLHIAKHLLDRR